MCLEGSHRQRLGPWEPTILGETGRWTWFTGSHAPLAPNGAGVLAGMSLGQTRPTETGAVRPMVFWPTASGRPPEESDVIGSLTAAGTAHALEPLLTGGAVNSPQFK